MVMVFRNEEVEEGGGREEVQTPQLGEEVVLLIGC